MTEESVSDGEALQSKILEIISNHPKDVTNKVLSEFLPSVTPKQIVDALNGLLDKKKIQLLQKGSQLIYKSKDKLKDSKYQGSDIEEQLILQIVENAGNDGISNRDIGFKCKLNVATVNKILKRLEDKRAIKSYKISARKKIFMLFDVEPSEAVTGGTFHSGEDFESEFVDVLTTHCYKYLVQAKALADKQTDPLSQRNASYKSSKDVCTYMNNIKLSKVTLSVKDIEKILEALIYDDKLEKCVSMSKDSKIENLYRVSKPLITNTGFTMVPCGVCEVYKLCHPDGDISPATCVYMKEWLDF